MSVCLLAGAMALMPVICPEVTPTVSGVPLARADTASGVLQTGQRRHRRRDRVDRLGDPVAGRAAWSIPRRCVLPLLHLDVGGALALGQHQRRQRHRIREAWKGYGEFFPGYRPVPVREVGRAFLKSVSGAQTGQAYRVGY